MLAPCHSPGGRLVRSARKLPFAACPPKASPAAGLEPNNTAQSVGTAQMAVLKDGELVLQPLPVQTQAGEESRSLQSRIRPWAVAAAFLLGTALVVSPARVLGDLFDVRCAAAGLLSIVSAGDVTNHKSAWLYESGAALFLDVRPGSEYEGCCLLLAGGHV